MTSARTQFVSNRQQNQSGSIWRRNQNMTSFSAGNLLGKNSTIVLTIVAILALFIMTVIQAMRPASFSYEFYEMDQRRAELASERDDLKVENARLQSLSRVKESSVAASMTEPVSTDYMN